MTNTLNYGDNLPVLREYIADASAVKKAEREDTAKQGKRF